MFHRGHKCACDGNNQRQSKQQHLALHHTIAHRSAISQMFFYWVSFDLNSELEQRDEKSAEANGMAIDCVIIYFFKWNILYDCMDDDYCDSPTLHFLSVLPRDVSLCPVNPPVLICRWQGGFIRTDCLTTHGFICLRGPNGRYGESEVVLNTLPLQNDMQHVPH